MHAAGRGVPPVPFKGLGRMPEHAHGFGTAQHHGRDEVHKQRRLAGAGRAVDREQAALNEGVGREVDRNLLHQGQVVRRRPPGAGVRCCGAGAGDEGPIRAVDPLRRACQEARRQAAVAVAHGAQHEPDVLEVEAVHGRQLRLAVPLAADRHGLSGGVLLLDLDKDAGHGGAHHGQRQPVRQVAQPRQGVRRDLAHRVHEVLVDLSPRSRIGVGHFVERGPHAAAECLELVVEIESGPRPQAFERQPEGGHQEAVGNGHAAVVDREHARKAEPLGRGGGPGVVVRLGRRR